MNNNQKLIKRMSNLITPKDYFKRIENMAMEELLKDDELSREEVLMDAEATAFSMIATYLQKRYDTHGIFKVGFQKERSVLKEWAVSIVLHLLYRKSKREIPGTIVLNYAATLKDLEYISLGKQGIDLPEKREAGPEESHTREDWSDGFDFEDSFDFQI